MNGGQDAMDTLLMCHLDTISNLPMANYFIWSITILLFKCLGHISKCSHTSMIKKHIVDSDSTRSCIKVFDAQA